VLSICSGPESQLMEAIRRDDNGKPNKRGKR
jgi:hypothetical protein